MYEEFFGLLERPFLPTPNPKYLFLSDSHRIAINHVIFAVKNKEGFAMITGEVGTGKTLLCRVLMKKLAEEGVEVAYVMHPSITSEDLFRTILQDFGLTPKGTSKKELVDELHSFLLDAHSKGRTICIMIDEAQIFLPSTLEDLRLLSNLETETQKLVQIILVGQPELLQLLESSGLRQLLQRIQIRAHLTPLGKENTEKYIYHRLAIAGSKGDILFTKSAIHYIWRISGGVPRLINAVCDKSLLAAFSRGQKKVSYKTVREAVNTIGIELHRATPKIFRIYYIFLPLIMAGVLVSLGIKLGVFGIGFTKRQESKTVERTEVEKEIKTEFSPIKRIFEILGEELPKSIIYSAEDDIQTIAKSMGYEVLTIQNIDITEIEKYNSPALIVTPDGGRKIVIEKISGDNVVYTDSTTLGATANKEAFLGFYKAYIPYKDLTGISVNYLFLGFKGEDVAALRNVLKNFVYVPDYRPNNVFDRGLENAVKRFQAIWGLKTDGIVGPNTKFFLSKSIATRSKLEKK